MCIRDSNKRAKIIYENEEDYWSVMNSLFMLEIRSQIHYQFSTKPRKFQKFLLKEVSQKPNMLMVKLKVKNSKIKNLLNEFLHHDLVLMTSSPVSENSPKILGIIDTSSKFFIRIKIIFQESSPKHQVFYDLFTLDSSFEIKKLCSLSTIGREFVGLDSMRKFVLKDCLLNSAKYLKQQKIKKNRYLTISKNLLMILKKRFNESQLKAIKNCLKIEGVTLIQGPPGTGKTKTIMGIVSVLLASEPKKEKKNLLSEKERNRILKLNKQSVILKNLLISS